MFVPPVKVKGGTPQPPGARRRETGKRPENPPHAARQGALAAKLQTGKLQPFTHPMRSPRFIRVVMAASLACALFAPAPLGLRAWGAAAVARAAGGGVETGAGAG